MSSNLDVRPKSTILKSHTTVDQLIATGAKIITCLRDPRDVCISHWYHHQRYKWYEGRFDPQLDGFVQQWLSGEVEYGSMDNWVSKLEQIPKPQPILALRYESMLERPEMHILAIAQYLNLPISRSLVDRYHLSPAVSSSSTEISTEFVDEMRLHEIVESTSFEALQSTEIRKKQSTDRLFFRKGVRGDWHQHLSDGQSLLFDHVTNRVDRLVPVDASPTLLV